MIHSLAGGSFREKKITSFAKVEILEGFSAGIPFWYTFSGLNLETGDIVLVPLGKENLRVKGRVIKTVLNAIEGQTPVPLNRAKDIIRKIEE